MNSIKSTNAINAYQNAAKMAESAFSISSPSNEQKIGPDFSELVNQAVGDAIDTQKVAENATAGSLINKTSIDDLSIAITNADLTLRTVVAVRDRVISAYQDIIKMPI